MAAPRLKHMLVGLLLLALAGATVLSIEAATSQGHAAALAAVREESGLVARELGQFKRAVLVQSHHKTLTINNVSRSCGANRYLVFAERGAAWVEVSLARRPNQWHWEARGVALGWNSTAPTDCQLSG